MSLTRAEKNKNPGNVNTDGWHEEVGHDGQEATFSDVSFGCRATVRNLCAKYMAGKRTIRQIIESWAPVSDGNDPVEYARAVGEWCHLSVTEDLALCNNFGTPLSFDTLLALCTAIERYEAGKRWVPLSAWLEGIAYYLQDYVEK